MTAGQGVTVDIAVKNDMNGVYLRRLEAVTYLFIFICEISKILLVCFVYAVRSVLTVSYNIIFDIKFCGFAYLRYRSRF